MVLGVGLEMLREVRDPSAQHGDLDLGRAGVRLRTPVLRDDLILGLGSVIGRGQATRRSGAPRPSAQVSGSREGRIGRRMLPGSWNRRPSSVDTRSRVRRTSPMAADSCSGVSNRSSSRRSTQNSTAINPTRSPAKSSTYASRAGVRFERRVGPDVIAAT
jgi:hypothetical protein